MNIAPQAVASGSSYQFVEGLIEELKSEGLSEGDAVCDIRELLEIYATEDADTAQVLTELELWRKNIFMEQLKIYRAWFDHLELPR